MDASIDKEQARKQVAGLFFLYYAFSAFPIREGHHSDVLAAEGIDQSSKLLHNFVLFSKKEGIFSAQSPANINQSCSGK